MNRKRLARFQNLFNNDLSVGGDCIFKEDTMSPRKDPGLSELLDDPIVAILMKSDGIERDHVLDLMLEMRRKLTRETPQTLAA